MSDLARYSRQILVDHIGIEGQEVLGRSNVLVVGAGGLGCQVLVQLAGAGVGTIHILDHDTVDASNLHRQILFSESDVGESKALCALRELRARNSDIQIDAQASRLSPENVAGFVEGRDLIIDAADNFAASYLLSDTCSKSGVPLLSASVNKSFGFLAVYCGTTENPSPSLRALFPKLPKEQQSCETVGVTGPSVGVIASLQAQEAIKVLTQSSDQLMGKILYANLWDYSMHCIDFSNAKEGPESLIKLIDASQIQANDQVIDVRESHEIIETPQDFESTHQIPLASISDSVENLDKNGKVILACKSGQRALVAAQELVDHGFENIAVILPN